MTLRDYFFWFRVALVLVLTAYLLWRIYKASGQGYVPSRKRLEQIRKRREAQRAKERTAVMALARKFNPIVEDRETAAGRSGRPRSGVTVALPSGDSPLSGAPTRSSTPAGGSMPVQGPVPPSATPSLEVSRSDGQSGDGLTLVVQVLDRVWVDMVVDGQIAVALLGQKEEKLTLSPGEHLVEIRERNGKRYSRGLLASEGPGTIYLRIADAKIFSCDEM